MKYFIIVAGFGRSGTTWLSDILSKTLGGFILFEPFHPGVYDHAERYCYTSSMSESYNLKRYINKCCTEPPHNPWLLRNHLKTPLDKNDSSFINYIWKGADVIGFKTIRSNHVLKSLNDLLSAKVILIHRHPLSVLTSILNRPNFWKEYSWTWHVKTFFNRTLIEKNFNPDQLRQILKTIPDSRHREESIVFMWAISFIISLRQMEKCDGFVISYEELYLDPYLHIRKIFNFLNKKTIKIHPSHIFTPSMTTLNTIHSMDGFSTLSRSKLDDLFWKDSLNEKLVERLFLIIQTVLSLDQRALKKATSCGYMRSEW